MESFDIAIVGGGILGAATAAAFLDRHDVTVVILEAESQLATHQTGRNSGVIHAGLYYKPGSLKATLCAEGREALYEFCQHHGIEHQRCGKIVVAANESDISRLDELERRGTANGLEGMRRLSREELREHEPNVAGVAGLFVPQTGIVNFGDVARSLAEVARANGAEIRTGARLTSVQREPDGLILKHRAGELRCSKLINCAGLHCDRVARICGANIDVRIVPFRGEYYDLRAERRDLVRNLIYPVPDPALPFLGVHYTRMVDGRVEVGPNAVLSLDRHGYTRTSFRWRDAGETLTWPGFWRMAARNWRSGMAEWYRSINRRAFVRAARQLVPDVQPEDLQWARAGVRAQAVDRSGRLLDDFHIAESERAIHVLNAPSPAATASLVIARTIAERAARQFSLIGSNRTTRQAEHAVT